MDDGDGDGDLCCSDVFVEKEFSDTERRKV